MKNARTFVLILAVVATTGWSRADAPHDGGGFDPASQPYDFNNPYETPAAFQPQKAELSPQERAALLENQREAQENKDWLLRGYEQQLQARGDSAGESGDRHSETNLYATLSADKDLAKAAGINPYDFTAPPSLSPLTGQDGEKPKIDLRPDPMLDPLASASEKAAPLFTPLIIPLDSPASTQVQTPYALPSPISSSLVAPLSFAVAPSETAEDDAAESVVPPDPGAMDVPGMTAAESNPAMREALDLPMPNDQVPDALPEEERPHHDLALELPVAANTDRLQKLQNSALAIPGQLPAKKNAPAALPLTLKPPGDTDEMVPTPSPLRNHLADPYDILR